MILDTLENGAKYFPSGSRFLEGIGYIRDFDASTPDGKHVLDGDRLFAIVSTYETEHPTERRLEAHCVYADIQAVVAGEEGCEWTPVAGLSVLDPFDAGKDVAFYDDRADMDILSLIPGRFAVFYPQDAHKPNCHLKGVSSVRKIVVKVKL